MRVSKITATSKGSSTPYKLPFKSGTIEWNLNDVNTMTLNIDGVYLRDYLKEQGTTIVSLFEGNFVTIRVYDENDTLKFAGYVDDLNYKRSTTVFTIVLKINSWLGYFERRIYNGTFSTATDAGSIAWTIINSVNDIGITQGTIETTKSRVRTYNDNWTAYKAVTHLSSSQILEGFEFDISNDKVFTVKSQLGTTRDNIVFNEKSIISWNVNVPLVGDLVNYGTIIGAGYEDDRLVRTYDAGTTYSNNWYKLEEVVSDINVSEVDTLDDKIEDYVTKRRSPVRTLTLDAKTDIPDVDEYVVGDYVIVDIPDAGFDKVSKRILQKKLSFSDSDNKVSLKFGYES
jgi:hypothetical protein